MRSRLQDALVLSEQGVRDLMRGTGFCVLANLVRTETVRPLSSMGASIGGGLADSSWRHPP